MLLDCTLRDGGYINDWKFGRDAIFDITKKLVTTNVNIVEIGFLKKESYNPDRTVFSAEKQIESIIYPKRKDILYAGMVEVMNPLPIEELTPRTDSSVDIIRVIVWKRLLKEGFEYCKAIAEKGYKVCVQPARVNQYSDQEFVDMINMFNQINPLAVYVVDSWGTQTRDNVLHYTKIADKHLKSGICVGYHGHNNLQQAFECAKALVELKLERDLIIDGSIYGIGRGAGNLNIELFAKYINDSFNTNYNIEPMYEIFSDYLENIYKSLPWGYSIPYFLTAIHDCNPEFAHYYGFEKKISTRIISMILSSLAEKDKVIFSKEIANAYLEDIRKLQTK